MFGGSSGSGSLEPYRDPNTNGDTVAPGPPADSVSCLAWSPQNLLAAGSWDKSVRVWQAQDGGAAAGPIATYEAEAPVLCCGFTSDGTGLVSGGCDTKVRLRDLGAQRDQELGKHDAPVKELAVVDQLGLVVSGSWDKTLRFWTPQQPTPALVLRLPERVYAMDVKFPLLLVGTADRHIQTFDLNQVSATASPQHSSFSQLKMQTRSLSLFPDRTGFAVGSVEGRCGISYFGDERKSFTFKCHRTDDTVYAVNSIDFNLRYGTFATAGSDGSFVFWDKERKQRLQRFNSCHYPITCGRFSPDSRYYAYAVSYDWSQGHEFYKPEMPRQVFLHRCAPIELRPR
mmetsp:Transcript_86094/g.266599  ORF Transcript_86094/g.266599 Transcript_86094/m.266599 type:complete len:342 (-) Transcript_86094:207-1232(-)